MPAEIRPEDYVSGTPADWAAAFQAALNDAKTLKRPIVLDGAKTYGVGSTGWLGLAIDAGHVDLRGNGAVIKVLVLPSQDIFVGGNRSLFRLTNTHGIRLNEVNFDLNQKVVVALCTSGCNDIKVDGGGAYNGALGPASCFVWVQKGNGFAARETYCHHLDYVFRVGHTSPGTEFNHVHITGNRAHDLEADLLVCTGTDIALIGNKVENLFTGVAISGCDNDAPSAPTTAKNVTIAFNSFKRFTAQGVQSDLVRGTNPDIRFMNVKVIGNYFESMSGVSSAFFCHSMSGFVFSNNTVKSQRGITLFNCDSGIISGNEFTGGTVAGIVSAFDAEDGDIENVLIDNNIFALGNGSLAIQLAIIYLANTVRPC